MLYIFCEWQLICSNMNNHFPFFTNFEQSMTLLMLVHSYCLRKFLILPKTPHYFHYSRCYSNCILILPLEVCLGPVMPHFSLLDRYLEILQLPLLLSSIRNNFLFFYHLDQLDTCENSTSNEIYQSEFFWA